MANYIGWQLVFSNIDTLSKDIQEIKERYLQRIGLAKQAPQDSPEEAATSTCIQTLQKALPLSLALLYVQNFVPADLQPKVILGRPANETRTAALSSDARSQPITTRRCAIRCHDLACDVCGPLNYSSRRRSYLRIIFLRLRLK